MASTTERGLEEALAHDELARLAWADVLEEQGHAEAAGLVRRFCSLLAASCTLDEWLEFGPTLVAHYPLEYVTLTDRKPDAAYGTFGWLERWRGTASNWSIPSDIFKLIEGGDRATYGLDLADYPSLKEANDALSAACLAWAKAQNLEASP